MNMSQLSKKTLPLSELSKNTTATEKKIIEAEKKYYQLVVALRNNRKALGLTQEKLAQLAKVPRTTITKVESGSRNATLQTLMALAHAMGKSVELRLS